MNQTTFMLKKNAHHSNRGQRTENGINIWAVAKPLRMSWGWERWKKEWKCRKDIGHCYHTEEMIDWFCCECGKETDGMPPHDCVLCKGKIGK